MRQQPSGASGLTPNGRTQPSSRASRVPRRNRSPAAPSMDPNERMPRGGTGRPDQKRYPKRVAHRRVSAFCEQAVNRCEQDANAENRVLLPAVRYEQPAKPPVHGRPMRPNDRAGGTAIRRNSAATACSMVSDGHHAPWRDANTPPRRRSLPTGRMHRMAARRRTALRPPRATHRRSGGAWS